MIIKMFLEQEPQPLFELIDSIWESMLQCLFANLTKPFPVFTDFPSPVNTQCLRILNATYRLFK